jgi:hypothetical protein
MSVARHHNEWLSLVDISGPFLSLPVLMRVFPQQLDTLDAGLARDARLAFSEWEDSNDNRAIHTAWLEFVLKRVLGYPEECLLTGQALPPGLDVRVAEHGEILRPSFAIKRPEDTAPAMLVMTYPPGQSLEGVVEGAAWRTASPATRMMTLLHGTGVSLGVVTNGADWQLVAAKGGQTTTYVTWDAAIWAEEPLTLRAFCALLGVLRAYGVTDSERLPALLAESAQNQQDVTDQLGYQVRKAVEVLVQAVDRANQDTQGRLLQGVGEKQLYEAALTVMMRLVFVLSAEERGLLLLGDPLWDRHYAVSTLRDQLREVADENLLTYRHDAWSRLLATFRAIFAGVEHDQMRLPAYGGALFDPDRFPFLEGRIAGTPWQTAEAYPLPVSNRTVLHLLEALQFLEMKLPGGGAEPRRMSFRALDIEQIGHVYEGLLDHTAKRALSPVLGLRGSSGDDVEIELERLEAAAGEGDDALVELLKDKTGRQAAAIRRDLQRGEPPNPLALQSVCAGRHGLYDRIHRFAHLLREDSAGQPVVIHTGSVYVTAGTDRRSTGTHYTPRTLTESVVKTTLDPLLYTGVDEGAEPTPETLKSPTEILALKVCDPACGSGAFLVQACRYLSERLVEAWGRIETAGDGSPLKVPEAIPAGAHHSQQLLPRDAEERLALARRLVAERCLYGVDFNPMAVEMAKLSLWLITLHKHRPFTFLDHAIKCGDSLLGLHATEQIESFHLIPARANTRLMDYIRDECTRLLGEARRKREQLERFTVLDIQDAEFKAKLHREAESALSLVRLLADLMVGAGLATAGSNEARSHTLLDAKLEELLLDVSDILVPREQERLAAEPEHVWPLERKADELLTPRGGLARRRPFHWLVEFPEVFLQTEGPGFDAVVGNPPFVGGQKITGLFGTDYRDYLVLYLADGRRGSADLCAYFFLRAGAVVRAGGNFGLLAVNTIAEGDTRQVALEAMLSLGYVIFAATPNFPWPGAAAVSASAVHTHRGDWRGTYSLAGSTVSTISAFLSSAAEWSPKSLRSNANMSFQGSILWGIGFTLSQQDAQTFLALDARNDQVLFPFLSGEDLNGNYEQTTSRWVVNFWDWPLSRSLSERWLDAAPDRQAYWLREGQVPTDYPMPVAEDFPDVLEIVARQVKPERQRRNEKGEFVMRKPLPQRWWHFGEKRPALYHAIGRGQVFAKKLDVNTHPEHSLKKVLAFTLHSKYWCVSLVDAGWVYSHALGVVASDSYEVFAILQSNVHAAWAWNFSSSLETRLRYTTSDVFETFPFPTSGGKSLEQLGRELHERRRELQARHNVGLTDLMNEFHSEPSSLSGLNLLRQAQAAVDDEVAKAFGWTDLSLGHDFYAVAYLPNTDNVRYTIREEVRLEILQRLMKLNRERYLHEQEDKAQRELLSAGVKGKGSSTRGHRAREKLRVVQGGLFDNGQPE